MRPSAASQLSGKPIATALTDANGRFVLDNVPVVSNLPIVIQVGKWRREIRLPSVTACVDNPITDANLTRLPRTKAEGHIPKMALTTGGSDALECLLRKIGVADSEFTTDTGAGRVHLYNGGSSSSSSSLGTDRFATTLNGGAVFPQATTLWGSASKMLGYDIVLMSCEGSTFKDDQEAVLRQHETVRRFGRPHLRQPPALHLAVGQGGPSGVAQHRDLHRRLARGARSAGPERTAVFMCPAPSTPRSPRGRRWPTGWSRSARPRRAARSSSGTWRTRWRR